MTALAIGNHDGRKLGDGFHVEITQRAPAGVGNVARAGVDGADFLVPQTPKIEEALLPPEDVLTARRILRVKGAGQVKPRGIAETLPAMFAVAHAAARPAVGEDAVRLVEAHDLFMHCSHELEVVRTESTGFPIAGIGGMPHRLAARIHPDPVRMRVVDSLPARVSVGPRNDVHAHSAACGQ